MAYPNGGSVIDNVNVSGSIYSNYSSGGIAGYTEVGNADLTITNSTVDVSISKTPDGQWGEDWGGIIGYYYASGNGTFNMTANQVSIEMMDENTSGLGGLVGYAELYEGAQMLISGVQTSGSIGCDTDCGGLIGAFYSDWNGTAPRHALTIEDSFSDAVVLSMSGNVGGFIGSYDANGSDATIATSGHDGTVQAFQGDNTGGLIGRTGSDGHYPMVLISESYVTNIQQQNEAMTAGSNLGGLVGDVGQNTHLVVENSYVDNSFIIGWGLNTGGLVGNNEETVDIANSYASGWFGAAGGNVGGLVGHMKNGSIANSFSTSDVEEIEGYLGGIVGLSDGTSTITYTYYNGNPYGNYVLTDCIGSEPSPEGCVAVNTDGSQEDYFTANHVNAPLDEWDFIDIWATKSNQLPRLQWTLPPPADPNVHNCSELQNITNHLGEDFYLSQDIDCTGVDFSPIGSGADQYIGTFNGNGHAITGLVIHRPGDDNVGLFSATTNANIHDVIIDGNVVGSHTVGGLIGGANGSTTVDNVTSHMTVVGNDDSTGGLIGEVNGYENDYASVTNSTATGSINGFTNVGGLIGFSSYATFTGDSATGEVVGNGDSAGGLVGDAGRTDISESFATGTVSTTGVRGGGLVGRLVEADISDSYATGDVSMPDLFYAGGLVGAMDAASVERSYATGHVSGYGIIGGLVGYIANPSTIADSFTTSIVTTNEIHFDEVYTNGFVGTDFYGSSTLTNNFYNADNGKPCAIDNDTNTITSDGCTGVSITSNPDRFKVVTDAPVSSWDMTDIWLILPNQYPCLRTFGDCTTDSDNDGTSNTIENNAPNNGDANGDGIQDAGQGNVTSWVNPLTNNYAVLEVSDCTNNNVAADTTILSSVISAIASDHRDSAYKYPAGVMGFTFHCGLACYPCSQVATLGQVHALCCPAPSDGEVTGTAATVTQYFYGDYDATLFVARKYNTETHTYTTIPGAVATNVTIGGQKALKVVYQIEDNGPLDQDPAIGTITDPSGPAVLVVAAPNTGLGGRQ